MNFYQKYIALRASAPFDKISANDAAAIANAAFHFEFAPMKTVAGKGSLPTHFFLVLKGSIKEGEGGEKFKIFGQKNLADMTPYSTRVYADESEGASCLVISREHFLSAIRNCPKLLTELFKQECCGENERLKK